jgi:chitinase
MKTNLRFIFIFCSFFLLSDIRSQNCKEIIGYCPNWQWYARNNLFNPNNIKYTDYTILNYCFFKPETTGAISSTDAVADKALLEGNASVVAHAHKVNVKVMASMGGWTLSDNFPAIAGNATKRAAFAGDCNKLLKKYDFDGIDIDWEYPGYDEHMGTAADKKNFTIFMKQIRDSITVLGTKTSKQYKLSACFGASADRASNIEWTNILPILDMINLMTYDFFGEWDAVANHNSPLYAPASGEASFNLNSAFLMLTQQNGVPASKINLGVAFYGRSQTGATKLFSATSGLADLKTFPDEEGAPAYYSVMANLSKFDYFWDNTAKVPYLFGKSGGTAAGTFVSYDDKRAIGLKATYINDKGARGAIIWDISHDLMETAPGSGVVAGNPLADTLHKVLCGWITTVPEEKPADAINVSIYPNPASDQATIILNLAAEGTYTVRMYDILGQELQSKKSNFTKGINQVELAVSGIKNGYYFINVQNEYHSMSKRFIINH